MTNAVNPMDGPWHTERSCRDAGLPIRSTARRPAPAPTAASAHREWL